MPTTMMSRSSAHGQRQERWQMREFPQLHCQRPPVRPQLLEHPREGGWASLLPPGIRASVAVVRLGNDGPVHHQEDRLHAPDPTKARGDDVRLEQVAVDDDLF